MRSDSELIEACRTGDDYALEELINRHTPALYAFVWRSVKDEALSSDIVQDTFLKVWQSLARFNTAQPFLPWLFTIARRTMIDHVRKRSLLPFSAFNNDEGQELFEAMIPDPEPLPDELFAQATLAEDLERALDTLSVDQRMIVLLHNHDNMTFEEIATIVDRPMNTVKSMYRRALLKLRDVLLSDRAPK